MEDEEEFKEEEVWRVDMSRREGRRGQRDEAERRQEEGGGAESKRREEDEEKKRGEERNMPLTSHLSALCQRHSSQCWQLAY